jgi:outer membrane lipoprotein-sorting protein
MNLRCRLASAAVLVIPLFLSGCSLLPTTRKLPIPKAPLINLTVAPEELVAQLNQRWAALENLTAGVEIQASTLKAKEGLAKDYPTIRGIILMRKPEMLRVYGRVPVIGTRAFDMVSDGKEFTLWIPSRNKVFKGANSLKKKSVNQLENLRPGFFLDALVVRGMEPDDLYAVVTDSETVEDAARKHLYSIPEYVLSISRSKPGSRELTPVRVITFRRDDLLPYQQDIFDGEGNLETHVIYSEYKDFGASKYPTMVVIKRPLEEVQVVLAIDKVVENQTLSNDEWLRQFELKPTEGTPIQHLE